MKLGILGGQPVIRMKDILELVSAQPFQPFSIHVSDGSSHEVPHPEMIKVAPTKVLVFIPHPNQSLASIVDYNVISMLHITRLEPSINQSKREQPA